MNVSLSDPFCPVLSEIMFNVAKSLMPKDRSIHRNGTYLCMEGTAFSTRAESLPYKNLGCSVIGMTNHMEARLAREAEIAYTTLAMSTDYECWHEEHEEHEDVNLEMIISNLKSNAKLASIIICKAIERIGDLVPKSKAHNALQYSLMTPKDKVPLTTRKKLIFSQRNIGEN